MNSLAQLTIDAHGGLERWHRFDHVSAHLRNGGVLWTLKHQLGRMADGAPARDPLIVTIDLSEVKFT